MYIQYQLMIKKSWISSSKQYDTDIYCVSLFYNQSILYQVDIQYVFPITDANTDIKSGRYMHNTVEMNSYVTQCFT